MLGFLIVLFALSGIQGKAFPTRYKRKFEASYHYIPYEEGIVRIPAGYSPENIPHYQDYINGHVQPNRHHWPVYYNPSVPFRSIQDPYSNVNSHHKIKSQHNWHFIDHNHIPVTRYTDGIHQFESDVGTPNGIEDLGKNDVEYGYGPSYEVPVKVKALASEDNMDHVDSEINVDSLRIKMNPIKYQYDKNPVGAYSSTKHKSSNFDLLTNKRKPSTSHEPVKLNANDDFELPVVVDSLTKKEKEANSYNVYEPSKEKPTKHINLASSNEFELPEMVESLGKKAKPVKVKPIVSYGEYELPSADSLGKKGKPVVVKPDASYYKEKPVATYDPSDFPLEFNSLNEADNDYDIPIVVEELIRKEKPTFQIEEDYETPVVVEALVRKHPGYEKTNEDKMISNDFFHPNKETILTENDEFEFPVVVDSLTKKEKEADSYDVYEPPKKPAKNIHLASSSDLELPGMVSSLNKKTKPVKVEPIASYGEYENLASDSEIGKPIVVESDASYFKYKPVKEKPIKEKPIKEKPIATSDPSNFPLGLNSLEETDYDYDTPIVVEALIRNEKPTLQIEEDYETPVVVETLVRKHPGYENEKGKEDKIVPNDFLHPSQETILTEDVMITDKPAIEAMSFDKEIESNEDLEQEGVTFDETGVLNDPDMNDFDETGDEGSAMDFHGSHFSKSFHPVNSDTFSEVTNIEEHGRRQFKSCVTLKKETGRCMPFQLCSLSSTASNIDELLRNICIIDEVFLGVCCPEFPVETVRVDWEQLKPDTDMLNENSSETSKECGRLPPKVTDQDPWPWMALLIARSSNKIFCGGALISDQYVLTAAHCTKRIPRNRIIVRLGSPTSENNPEEDLEVIEIKRHLGYNPRTMQNDMALLKLSRRVRFGDFRRAVCLAKDEEGIESLVSETASLLRWKGTPGEIKDNESLSVISNRECQNGMRTVIADSIICTEPRTDETMCNADSGAPLIIAKDDKFEVIGILTWNRNDCDGRFPTVFTRVSSYHRWIEKLAT